MCETCSSLGGIAILCGASICPANATLIRLLAFLSAASTLPEATSDTSFVSALAVCPSWTSCETTLRAALWAALLPLCMYNRSPVNKGSCCINHAPTCAVACCCCVRAATKLYIVASLKKRALSRAQGLLGERHPFSILRVAAHHHAPSGGHQKQCVHPATSGCGSHPQRRSVVHIRRCYLCSAAMGSQCVWHSHWSSLAGPVCLPSQVGVPSCSCTGWEWGMVAQK